MNLATLVKRAPAKLNLTLDVGEKREDSYHSLSSIMVHISLYDEISIEKTDSKIEFQSNAKYLKNDDKNLCVLAAKRYFEAVGIENEGVLINLKKVIPSKSGMGGGSADAAAVIELLEELYTPLDERARISLAMSLGADVPFCLTKTPAFCEGIGEIITPVSLSKKKIYTVVAKNAQKLSTAAVYSEFDKNPVRFEGSHTAVIKALETGNIALFQKGMFNSFENGIFKALPEVEELKNKMLSLGAFASQMTGAGQTVFGLFEEKEKAEKALSALRDEHILSYIAYIV
jgi:4-diphosphocytidyl-2-C-methyl-D-erythritol kinase